MAGYCGRIQMAILRHSTCMTAVSGNGSKAMKNGLERNHKNFTENLFQEKKQNYDYYRNEKEVVPGIAFGMKFFKEC